MEKNEYKAYFFTQWENVIVDFTKKAAEIPVNVEDLNRWYTARVFRWSSISETERMVLDDLNLPEFADQLRQTLNSFKFIQEESGTVASAGPMLAGSVVVGLALGTVLRTLLHCGWPLSVAGCILLIILGGWYALDCRSKAEAKRDQELNRRYSMQLREYTKKLEQVFTKYGFR